MAERYYPEYADIRGRAGQGETKASHPEEGPRGYQGRASSWSASAVRALENSAGVNLPSSLRGQLRPSHEDGRYRHGIGVDLGCPAKVQRS